MSNANARLSVVSNQVRASSDENDVVIVSARRTPICRAKRGNFKDTLPCDLLAPVLEQVVKDANLRPEQVEDICVGNVLQPSSGAVRARMAGFYAGFPETTTLSVVNRQCSSGLQAVMNVAGAIKSGVCDIAIGAGFESMTKYPMGVEMDQSNFNLKTMDCQKAVDCTTPMGVTSENVAERYGISRLEQDKMAMESHKKAAAATASGKFREEIVPVKVTITDKDGNERTVTVDKDDGIRANTTLEVLAKLKPSFKPDGTTTAGNSSQISDGAAAVLVARRSTARQLGLPVLGVLKSYAVVGVAPDEMGIGPAYAIPEALKKANLTLGDIDVYEINEAFASQATYCVNKLGIPMSKVNPNGGAIALGHPLGVTGARQIATLLHELKRRGRRSYGVVSMCIGTGMGAAAVLEYEG